MKKLFVFLCCMFVLNASYAAKNCLTTSCPTPKSGSIPSQGVCGEEGCWEYIRAAVGSDECYSCDSDDYGIGSDQCAYKQYVGQMDAYNRIVGVYECVDVGGSPYDMWRSANPTNVCKNSPLKGPNSDSETYYLLVGRKSEAVVTGGDHPVIPAGHNTCVYYVCKSGLVPDENGINCVAVNSKCRTTSGTYKVTGYRAKIECEKNAGTISGVLASNGALTSLDNVITGDSTKCTAMCKTDGWDITLNDSSSCKKGYEPDAAKKKCVKTQATINAENAAAAASMQKACTQTGGKWQGGKCVCDSEEHLTDLEQNRTCKCVSGYELIEGQCVITDIEQRKQICESADDADWNPVNNKCVCRSKEMMISFNYGTGKCEQDSKYAACIKAASSGAYWNESDNKCDCSKTGYFWNGSSCKKSEDLIAQENETMIRNNINRIATKISGGIAGWEGDLSVWKTSEGNFNGARLASDSIAGVVLGTAGGLITSNVVKKNQVRSGFEDVQCTVGGQKVADWKDEFTVGVR